jgi:cell division septation protein DedD
MTRNKSSRSATPAARTRASHGNGRGGTLLGVFVGLVIGLLLAAGVAYYVTKANSPYAAQTARDAREPGRDSPRDAGKGGKPDAPAAEKPRFDFYKILPGGEEPKVQVERKVAPDRAQVDQAKDRDAERAPAKVAAAEPAAKGAKAGERYRVRLGPYDNTDELNRIKSDLGRKGFDVAVIKF